MANLDEARRELLDALFHNLPMRDLVELCAGLIGSPLRFTSMEHPEGGILSRDYPAGDFQNWRSFVLENGHVNDNYGIFLSELRACVHFQKGSRYPSAHSLSLVRWRTKSRTHFDSAGSSAP